MKVKAQNPIQSCVVASSYGQNRHEENLRYIEDHRQIFDIENSYLLNSFEEFIGKQRKDKGGAIVCACNIEKDRRYPARFYYSCEFNLPNPAVKLLDLEEFLSFSYRIEGRPEVQIDRRLLEQFLATGLDPSKVHLVIFGIDARPELRHSRIKLSFHVRDYPEKMAIAIALCGEQRNWEKLIVNGNLLVAFDLFFDNRSSVEVYPTFYPADLQRPDVQAYLAEKLPARALQLLNESGAWLQIGISDENDSDVLYFNSVKSPNSFVDQLGNEMLKQVHAHYRNRVFEEVYIAIPESEFSATSIQRVKMYYQMNKFVNKMESR